MRLAILLLFIISNTCAYAQNLTGIWRGSFVASDRLQNFAMPADRYKLEVQIDQHEKVFNSVTYSYKTTLFYGKATANGTINPQTGKVWLEETKIVELKMQFGSACIMTYKFQYSKNDNEEFLEGTWVGYGEKDSLPCGKGTVLLHKVLTSDFYKEPFLKSKDTETKKDTLAKVPLKVPNNIAKKSAPVKPPTTTSAKPKPDAPIAKNNPKPPLNVPGSKTAPLPPAVAKTNPGKETAKPPASVPPVKNNAVKKTPPVTSPADKPLAAIKPAVPKSLQNSTTMEDTLKRAVPMLKKSTAVINIPKVLSSRENELIKTITLNTNEISINIYDNGTIDHDTVSVYLDKKLVISKQMLTTSPLNIKFSMDDLNDVHELVMVAENEGDIPPNTSLMVVRAGDKVYEVRITSTEQKNAVVLFKFEKPK